MAERLLGVIYNSEQSFYDVDMWVKGAEKIME